MDEAILSTAEKVEIAALWLDQAYPGWAERVPKDFDIKSGCNCVGHYVAQEPEGESDAWERVSAEFQDAVPHIHGTGDAFASGQSQWEVERERRLLLAGKTADTATAKLPVEFQVEGRLSSIEFGGGSYEAFVRHTEPGRLTIFDSSDGGRTPTDSVVIDLDILTQVLNKVGLDITETA